MKLFAKTAISKEVALEKLLAHGEDYHVDSRVIREVKMDIVDEAFYECCLDDQDQFLSLIWCAIDESRLLTPDNKPRTIRHVVERMISNGWTPERLWTEPPLIKGEHTPDWFIKCKSIIEDFDYTRFGWIVACSPTEEERRSTPTGSYYVFDGNNRSLVLGWLLLKKVISYEPVTLLIMEPRR